ncbi:MAG TPA: DUF1804 family protein [Oleiagrimonas sp.]|nr:DUF1804 family protein [Oleiagrimonas sp.]
MAHSRLKKAEVRRHYVVDRQPLTGAAQLAGVAYSTARQWKAAALVAGDDWDRARLAAQVTDGGSQELTRVVLAEFVPMFKSTVEGLRDAAIGAAEKAEAISRLADAYTKTVKAAGAVDPAIARLAWAMDVLKELGEFTQREFPQHSAAMLEMLEPFGQYLAEQYG